MGIDGRANLELVAEPAGGLEIGPPTLEPAKAPRGNEATVRWKTASYDVRGLEPGTYTLRFADPCLDNEGAAWTIRVR